MADYQLSYTGDQVNTAIGQIVDKNITGTLTIETLDLTNPLAITQGGTGKNNRTDAFSNLADYGTINETVANDIPGVWGEKGSGVHSFLEGSGGGSIESIYSGSTIYNWVTYRYEAAHLSPDTVTQFRIVNGGSCYTRFGYTRQSDWSTPWTLATKSIQIKKVWENAAASSAFRDQTITVESGDAYIVVCRTHTNDSNNTISCIAFENMRTVIIGRGFSNAPLGIVTRAIQCSGGNLTFSKGYSQNTYGSDTENNSVMIPIEIYSMKGVI